MTISFYKIFNLNINFSWDELENAYESVIERYNLNTSLNDIDKQIYKFRRDNEAKCVLCPNADKLHVDHIIHFDEIYFIKGIDT